MEDNGVYHPPLSPLAESELSASRKIYESRTRSAEDAAVWRPSGLFGSSIEDLMGQDSGAPTAPPETAEIGGKKITRPGNSE